MLEVLVAQAPVPPGHRPSAAAHALLQQLLAELTGRPAGEHVLVCTCATCGGDHLLQLRVGQPAGAVVECERVRVPGGRRLHDVDEVAGGRRVLPPPQHRLLLQHTRDPASRR